MSTVVSRTFRSTPWRDAHTTWTEIVELLTEGKADAARTELLAVSGIAASVIADHAPDGSAIVVTCDGPRTRIYCIYDDDAIDGADSNEDSLGFDPLKGNWRVSLPCPSEDLDWIQRALKELSSRITARDRDTSVSIGDSANTGHAQNRILDPRGFLGL